MPPDARAVSKMPPSTLVSHRNTPHSLQKHTYHKIKLDKGRLCASHQIALVPFVFHGTPSRGPPRSGVRRHSSV